MAEKLTDIFQVSRMMLPEHKARIIQSDYEAKNPRRERPTLDQQEYEEISDAFARSLYEDETIKVHFYDPYQTITLEAVVQEVNINLKKVKMAGEWYPLKDIIGVG